MGGRGCGLRSGRSLEMGGGGFQNWPTREKGGFYAQTNKETYRLIHRFEKEDIFELHTSKK